ncbi:DUF6957 family protein [Pseudomonas abietaniphila]|uniref:DUF6957 domain-containing protein n=1 Tax=Pseudomonas abietaniphila TaxID=89065 RepID=A0A1G8PQZ5_9PSED|nr:hypothetical protein [Pseudomonas abietaniphila]SDI94934.1 hypothetical protein SAMN05216605_11983 [Pseudomonas abietaniphila]
MSNKISTDDLIGAAGQPIEGSLSDSMELIARVQECFPGKPYCLVEQWTVFQADLSSDELETVHRRGHLPLFLYAHSVVQDSRRRFQPGDWVRSSMCVSFGDGVMFETRNTVYMLMGSGSKRTASLKTIFSFF